VIKDRHVLVILISIAFFLFPLGDISQAADQTDEPPDRLLIDYNKNDLTLTLYYQGQKTISKIYCGDIGPADLQIYMDDKITFAKEGLITDGVVIPYELLKRMDTEKISKGHVIIEFKIREKPSRRPIPSDVINAFTPLEIDSERFVRGDVISIGSDVDIFGEVSKSVICFWGDITLHPQTVVRGDVIAICGQVHRLEDSQVYGQIISRKGWQKGGRLWGSRRGYYRDFSLIPELDYNRVDGFFLNGEFRYEDPDRVFPTISLGLGYAFTAERLRYNLDFSQKIFDYYSLEPYGRVYRETATEDDWVCSRHENLAYTLIVNEDFRDYYEKEGGAVGLKIHLGPFNTFDFQYSYDAIDWMDSHPLLWSLFGKKEFRSNFSALPYDLKEEFMDDFDSKMSLFKFTYTLDTKISGIKNPTGWHGLAQYEKAGGDLKGDLSFSRWLFSLTRYQEINRHLALNLRAVYAGSNDRLPLFKKYFLGGLRTLRGYKHKLFYGDQMLLANAEYIIELSNELDAMVFFDIGKVAGQDDAIFSDGEFKSDAGIAVGFFPGFRLELAKALDKSDSDIKLWVTFERTF